MTIIRGPFFACLSWNFSPSRSRITFAIDARVPGPSLFSLELPAFIVEIVYGAEEDADDKEFDEVDDDPYKEPDVEEEESIAGRPFAPKKMTVGSAADDNPDQRLQQRSKER